MINAERAFVDGKVNKIIALKNLVCANGEDFLVVNMKGIDTGSLELLQKVGISAVRRAKLRNMERTTLACGGRQMNSVETLSKDCLGWAGHVYEETIGEDKWVFIEEVKEPKSVTILMKGPNQPPLKRIQDAVKDGLRAVNNAMEAKFVVPGAGAFEVALYNHLMEFRKKVEGKDRLGIEAFAAACLEIPRVIAKNASHDCVDVLVRLEAAADKGQIAGVGIEKGDPIDPIALGIWDNVIVKRHQLQSAPAIASQLLAIDEVIRAGGKVQK
uniref:Chaperonin family, CCT zeta subunit n=1 Tax=Coptotermes formosanus TaxID=36987 RepID=R4V4P6_COPFO|nr:chaperonin family, CCT zeta subunit [Coptotermes formosanus]